MPPLQAHTDSIVFENETEVLTQLTVSHESHKDYHENDTEEEKSKEHHHHCNVITLTAEFVPIDYSYNIPVFYELRSYINFYQDRYYNSHLSVIFQPPKF